ncbi:MAG: recombination-associated protein RdgC [Alphaproteobacteria bacterium]|nr:recombination-associated protein RdgC [Alphaproteobacteria bacterium]
MGILKGPMTARRYIALGEVPDGFRERYVEALNANAFREPFSKTSKEETVGWVSSHNLLDTDFTDLNMWLYNQYALFSLRVDKKSLPANLFRATLEQRGRQWCEEHGQERLPRSVKNELKDNLEFEWLQRTLPRVQVTEVVWNVVEGTVLYHSLSQASNDRFRKLFHRTFGLALEAVNPLDLITDDTLAAALERTGGSDLRVEV